MPLNESSHGPDQAEDLNHSMDWSRPAALAGDPFCELSLREDSAWVESEKRFVVILFCQSRSISNPKFAKILERRVRSEKMKMKSFLNISVLVPLLLILPGVTILTTFRVPVLTSARTPCPRPRRAADVNTIMGSWVSEKGLVCRVPLPSTLGRLKWREGGTTRIREATSLILVVPPCGCTLIKATYHTQPRSKHSQRAHASEKQRCTFAEGAPERS